MTYCAILTADDGDHFCDVSVSAKSSRVDIYRDGKKVTERNSGILPSRLCYVMFIADIAMPLKRCLCWAVNSFLSASLISSGIN